MIAKIESLWRFSTNEFESLILVRVALCNGSVGEDSPMCYRNMPWQTVSPILISSKRRAIAIAQLNRRRSIYLCTMHTENEL